MAAGWLKHVIISKKLTMIDKFRLEYAPCFNLSE